LTIDSNLIRKILKRFIQNNKKKQENKFSIGENLSKIFLNHCYPKTGKQVFNRRESEKIFPESLLSKKQENKFSIRESLRKFFLNAVIRMQTVMSKEIKTRKDSDEENFLNSHTQRAHRSTLTNLRKYQFLITMIKIKQKIENSNRYSLIFSNFEFYLLITRFFLCKSSEMRMTVPDSTICAHTV
jgi:hypothetical protein